MAVRGDGKIQPQIKLTNLPGEGTTMMSSSGGVAPAGVVMASSPPATPPAEASAMFSKWKYALEKRKVKTPQTQRQPGTLSLYQKASFFGQRGTSPNQSPVAKLQAGGVPPLKAPPGAVQVKVAPVVRATKPYVRVKPSEQQYRAILAKSTATVSPIQTTPTVVAQQCRLPSSFTILTPVVTPPPLVTLPAGPSQPQPIIVRQIPVQQPKPGATTVIRTVGTPVGSPVQTPISPGPQGSVFSHIKGVDVSTRLGVPRLIVPLNRPQTSPIRPVQTVVCTASAWKPHTDLQYQLQ